MTARQNQVLLNALHKRWPETGRKFRSVRYTVRDKSDQLQVRKSISGQGWFVSGCYVLGGDFMVDGVKPL